MATLVYNNATQTVAPDGIIEIPILALQKGCATSQAVNGVRISKTGLYDITSTVTAVVTGGGIFEMSVLANGSVIPYMIGTGYSDTGEPVTITLHAPIETLPNCCAVNTNLPQTIILQNTGTTTALVNFVSLYAEKIS